MSGPRPWWASEGPVDGGVDPGEDPLVAHRAARRGGADADPTDGADPAGDADHPAGHADHTAGQAEGSDTDAGAGFHPGAEICGVCPVCIAARRLGESRPELLASLAEAGRHLGAALRALLETPSHRGDDHDPDPDDRGVRRIDLD